MRVRIRVWARSWLGLRLGSGLEWRLELGVGVSVAVFQIDTRYERGEGARRVGEVAHLGHQGLGLGLGFGFGLGLGLGLGLGAG